jgi:hypothetical protein
MVNLTLHVENRRARVFSDFVKIGIPHAPVAMADGNAIKVTPKNFANLFRGIAMLDLGGFALDEGSVPT